MSDSWTTGPAPAPKSLSVAAQAALTKFGSEDGILVAWSQAKSNLDVAKEVEAALRLVVMELKFPNPTEGTSRVPLANGWHCKLTYNMNFDLDKDRTADVQEAMCQLGVKQSVIAERLINWKPELSIKEYRLLEGDTSPEGMALRSMLSGVLTIKPPGLPQLTMEPPKPGA